MGRTIMISCLGMLLCAAAVFAGPLVAGTVEGVKPVLPVLPTCPRPPKGAFDTTCFDLSNGQREVLPRGLGLRWESYKPLSNQEEGCCSDQARLKITPPCWAKSLRIDETSVNSEDWTFNLGDSTSNNGWAGDSGHHTLGYSAEAQILNGIFKVYKNDLPQQCKSEEFTDLAANLGASHTMSMRVTKYGLERQSLPAVPGNHKQVCNDKCLFDWSTMYLGMNRVVTNGSFGSDRVGSGLCKVCLTWEPRSFCKTPIISVPPVRDTAVKESG